MDEKRISNFDTLIQILKKHMNEPKSSFVLGGIFFMVPFYFAIHKPSNDNYKQMLAVSHKDIQYWKSENEQTDKECKQAIKNYELRLKETQDEALNNILKTNSFLKDLKSDKVEKATLSRELADTQTKLLK